MEKIVLLKLPFDSATIAKLENIVRETSSIISPSSNFDQFRFIEYAKERDLHGVQFHALFDLNVTVNVLRLASLRNADKSMRETAALLAILIIADVNFDVGFSLLEYVQNNSLDSVYDQINLFRSADNVAPNIYADIALGRRDRIRNSELPAVMPFESSFSNKPHYNWNLHYMGLLGLVAITKGPGRSVDKLCKYLKWMWDQFVFSAPCILFSIIYLSKPLKGMFKDIGSSNHKLVLGGIQNAAWDLATAHFWSARVIESVGSKDQWIFCTYDKALQTISKHLISNSDESEYFQRVSSFVSAYWPDAMTDRIMDVYVELHDKRHDPRRRVNQIGSQQDFLKDIPRLEQLVGGSQGRRC